MSKTKFPIYHFTFAVLVAIFALSIINRHTIYGYFSRYNNDNNTNIDSNTTNNDEIISSKLTDECPVNYPNCTSCDDLNPKCGQLAELGECDTHPGWMTINCAKSCKHCHFHDYYVRCVNNPKLMNDNNYNNTPSLHENYTLNDMFNGILKYYYNNKNKKDIFGNKLIKYKIKTLSSPNKHDKYISKKNKKRINGPWILRFDNFVSKKEAQQIINVAGTFERSTDVGKRDNTGHFEKVVSKSRTSKNSWCQNRCWEDPTVQTVMNRISKLLGINVNNTETFQILKYDINEYYKQHHDFIQPQTKMSCGPRILTFFLYLSDVEDGGETSFPLIKIKNKPKLGRAILWPSVLDSNPLKMDKRTYHAALKVKKGVKYAANAWFHLNDFQTPNLWSCTG